MSDQVRTDPTAAAEALRHIPSLTKSQPWYTPVEDRIEEIPLQRGRSRRELFGLAAKFAVGLGIGSLGVFAPARKAFAGNYDIYGSCPSYAANHQCEPGCGPSTTCSYTPYEATLGTFTGHCCDNRSAWTPPYSYHEDDRWGEMYYLRPDECVSGGYDGWRWGKSCFDPAAPCPPAYEDAGSWDCHDGWTGGFYYAGPPLGYWIYFVKTICKWQRSVCA